MATFNATTGTDTPIQTTGNDTVVITNTNQIQVTDVFDGNLGTDTILISATAGVAVDATAAGTAAFKFYEGVAFDNTSGTSSLTLNASSIGAATGQLPNNLNLTGVLVGKQQISILNANVFSAANWTFTNWGSEDIVKISGTAGNNTLTGSSVKDELAGGLGDDTYFVQTSNDIVVESSSTGGTDTVHAAGGFTLGNNVENLVLQSLTGVTATGNGNSLNNVITGGLGNDFIDGKVGADTMAGGAGDDKYFIDNAGDTVTEGASAGIDIVSSSVTHTLGSNFENLTLLGGALNINGTGNTLANTIIGNAGINQLTGGANNDILDGKAGADQMFGGTGHDTYYVDNAGDSVSEVGGSGIDTVISTISLTLAADIEKLKFLSGAQTGTGNSLDNTMIGAAGNNTLIGLGGNDILDGGRDVDQMTGGIGDDTYYVDNALDVVTENSSEGTDEVKTKVTYTLANNVENLTFLGNSGNDGTGNSLANIITGNGGGNVLNGMGGNDTINGGGGVDDMFGGAGDDTMYVDNIGDEVFENASEGTDTVISTKNFTLGLNIENLTLTGTQNIYGTGNALNNNITGNDGKNVLDGAGGTDTLAGGAGDDTYVIDSLDSVVEASGGGTDLVKASFTYTLSSTQEVENLTLVGTTAIDGTGNSLANVITGANGANVLSGLAGADTLDGLGGTDTLAGGTGADILTGGNHDDVFLFSVLADSNSASGVDQITDFTAGDKINVSGIDANTGVASDQAFVADANDVFVAGEYDVVADVDGYVFVNFYNDAVAGIDMQIRVKAAVLSDSDFVL